jgi:hypothetical protein
MRWLAVIALVLGLAACTGAGDASLEATLTPDLGAGAAITGTLSADDVEGGCLVLTADDGERYEMIWPDGWQVSSQLEVVNADGEVVAEGGDRITVRGEVADDMASICQIGQIFEATEVTLAE